MHPELFRSLARPARRDRLDDFWRERLPRANRHANALHLGSRADLDLSRCLRSQLIGNQLEKLAPAHRIIGLGAVRLDRGGCATIAAFGVGDGLSDSIGICRSSLRPLSNRAA